MEPRSRGTDGDGFTRRVPVRMGPLQRVPTTIAPITGTSAPILIAILESDLALTNVLATTATGSAAAGGAFLACSILFLEEITDGPTAAAAALYLCILRVRTATSNPAREPEGIDEVRQEHLGKSGLITRVVHIWAG